MFPYLLIAAELAVLLPAYYFLYIWEPREYRVKKDIWGLYEGRLDNRQTETNQILVFSNQFRNGFRVLDNTNSGTRPTRNGNGRRRGRRAA